MVWRPERRMGRVGCGGEEVEGAVVAEERGGGGMR